ncbi:hypothetical protein MKX01_033592 [Papaver californicum]|nr:hypothetical protein MKX01_033592 [Papaver californicum]
MVVLTSRPTRNHSKTSALMSLWRIRHFILEEFFAKVTKLEKNCKLNDLLEALDFNQVVIFVKSLSRAAELNKRAAELNKLLMECNFPSICTHSGMSQEEMYTFSSFLDFIYLL